MARGGALAALVGVLAGCATSDTPAYVALQNSISHSIIKDDQRQVRSTACTPHVKDVSYSDGFVHLHCVVRFADGTSYSTEATIEARSYQVSGWNFTFDEPGPLRDITTAPLPRPAAAVAASSGSSLFYARNLRPLVTALGRRFATNQLILALALYPGELEAVIGADGEAQMVSAHASGALTVGPQTPFSGRRSGIAISQLNPAVPQRLVQLIAAHRHTPMSRLDRFVLGSDGDVATWEIYANSGRRHFQADVLGDALRPVPAGG